MALPMDSGTSSSLRPSSLQLIPQTLPIIRTRRGSYLRLRDSGSECTVIWETRTVEGSVSARIAPQVEYTKKYRNFEFSVPTREWLVMLIANRVLGVSQRSHHYRDSCRRERTRDSCRRSRERHSWDISLQHFGIDYRALIWSAHCRRNAASFAHLWSQSFTEPHTIYCIREAAG